MPLTNASNNQSPKNANRVSRETARHAWIGCIMAVLRRHRHRSMSEGETIAKLLLKVEYIPQLPAIMCRFKPDKGVVHDIFIDFKGAFVAGQLNVEPVCTCVAGSFDYCPHTYAAMLALEREFADRDSGLVSSILGEPEPSWQTALKTLDRFLEKKPTPDVVPQEVVKPRLAWRLIKAHNHRITIDPIEQSPGKRGGWNKGKVLDWFRVSSKANLQLLPVDHEVMRETTVSHYGPDSQTLGKIANLLVGHPNVYFDAAPVTVVRGELGLMLEEDKSDWRIVPAINGQSLESFTYYSIQHGEYGIAVSLLTNEVFVARAGRELWELAAEFITERPVVPPEMQPELLKRIPLLEARLPVGLPESMKGEFVPAETRLALRLTPLSVGGTTVQIQAQPAPKGAYYSPGEGPIEVPGQVDGVRVQVARDPDDERFRAGVLAKDLFLHRFPPYGQNAWTMPSDDDVLDLLDTVRARPSDDPKVVWPEESDGCKMQVLGEIAPSSLRIEVKDQRDWFGLSGSIEIGGQKISLADLLAALKGGRRYLDLGQGQFATISQQFRDRLARVTDMIHSNRGKLEFNSTAAPVLADLFEGEVTLKASKKWRDSLNRLKKATELDPVVPSTLTAELRDYQIEGYKWLRRLAEWGVGGCLADDMGLGKTVQAIAVLLDRREIGPTLIVAPVSVGFNWMREVQRFAPTLNPILYRDTDRSDFLKSLKPGDLLITSYYLLQQHSSELAKIKWGTFVLDEAQAVKNSQTKTAQVVREIDADWRLALTGTPVENHLGELWSLFRAVAPGLFGSLERFREVFSDPIEKGKDSARKQALSRVIRPFILRRTKSQVLTELPARTEIQLTAELSKEERQLYEDARLWAVTNLSNLMGENEKDQRFQVLAALTKLRQLACHPRLVDKNWKLSSAKLDLFLDTIDELREGRHRALVFSQFTQHLALVRAALDERKISYQYLDGSTPVAKRQLAVDAFQRGEGELFLISLKAGGTGLNLTGADYVVHLDPWWNPAVEDQATDRAHRIGQTRPVTVYRLVAKDTIEEQILKLHADKRGLVAGILEGTDAAAKLSTVELVDLIKSGGRDDQTLKNSK